MTIPIMTLTNIKIGVLTLSLMLGACSLSKNSSFESPQEKVIGLEEKLPLEDGNAITYNRLVADSRCPVNADCIWQGEATVELTLTGSHTITFQLTTPSSQHPNAYEVEVGNYWIRLVKVAPFPGSEETKNEVTLRIQRR